MTLNRKNRVNHKDIFDFIYQNENIFYKPKEEGEIYERNIRAFSQQIVISNIGKSYQEKKSNYLLNKNKFMEKVMNIVEEGLLPDIMEFPNGLIDSTNRFNNIIYYDENIEFIKSIKKESDIFENKTSGAFILCSNLTSLSIVKDEILKQIKKDKRIRFNLITTGSACEKIMDFILKNPDFDACINNICFYCMKLNKYQYLKQKYPKIHNDIYNKVKDVINFIQKFSDVNIKPFQITKLLSYQDYQKNIKIDILKFVNFMEI